jgi:CRISPR-associated protein Cst1
MTAPASVTGTSGLRSTAHPLQRCGAGAIAELAGRGSVAEVSAGDLGAVAERVTDDMVRAAGAPNDSAGYDWWKVLFALYPNSPPTHSRRSKDAGLLRQKVAALFEDDTPGTAGKPCVFCGQSAHAVWGKDRLPMFDSPKALNVLPPRTPGWPVCRACRIAVWALPYGAWLTAGSATVLTCGEDGVEREFAVRNVTRARRILHLGFAGLPANAFNQIGEALPTIIIDGTVAGTWSWNTRTATISTDLIAGKTTPAIRRQVKARAAALTETLRSAWVPRLSSPRPPGPGIALPGHPRR